MERVGSELVLEDTDDTWIAIGDPARIIAARAIWRLKRVDLIVVYEGRRQVHVACSDNMERRR